MRGSALPSSVLLSPSSVLRPPPSSLGLAVIALAAGIAVPWAIANVAIESIGFGGLVRGAAFAAVAAAAPVAAAMALAAKVAVPPFSRILSRPAEQAPGWIAWTCGAVLMAATILALQTALGLVFDPRYRDFAFAQLTAAAVPFAVVAAFAGPRKGSPKGRPKWSPNSSPKASRSRAETIAAATLAGSALYIIVNEGFANWQALWFAAALIVLALTLARTRDMQT
jgi:glucan 1,3-beta-glucosidase